MSIYPHPQEVAFSSNCRGLVTIDIASAYHLIGTNWSDIPHLYRWREGVGAQVVGGGKLCSREQNQYRFVKKPLPTSLGVTIIVSS